MIKFAEFVEREQERRERGRKEKKTFVIRINIDKATSPYILHF